MKQKKSINEQTKASESKLVKYVKIGCLLFFISALMFILGVMVERGVAPVKFDIKDIQEDLASMGKAEIKKEQQLYNTTGTKIETAPSVSAPLKTKKINKKLQNNNADSVYKKSWVSQKKKTINSQQKNNSIKKLDEKKLENFYAVQIASLKDHKYADKTLEKLKQKGYRAYIIKIQIPSKGLYYRVMVGRFDNRKDASALLIRLKKEKLFGVIILQKG